MKKTVKKRNKHLHKNTCGVEFDIEKKYVEIPLHARITRNEGINYNI